MRKLVKAALAATAVAAAMFGSPATAQAADVGDGSWTCNSTEICFRYLAGSDDSIKHFFNGANHYSNSAHGAYYFGGPVGGQLVMDNAQEIRNRDSQCRVYLWDVDGSGNWYTYNSQNYNSSSYTNIVSDRNNGHSRCSEGSPANK